MYKLSCRWSCVLVALLIAVSARVFAHPGTGIVQNSRGEVYFTDLKQVWRVSADGKQSIAVPQVHTHELYVDRDDNLYGEHLWYEGDATQKWKHRVWRMTPEGTFTDIIPETEGFRTDYSFARDGGGAMYWAEMTNPAILRKRLPEGRLERYSSASFGRVTSMTVTQDGTLYLIDSGALHKVTPAGECSTLVAQLSTHEQPPATVSEVNYHLGMWTHGPGAVYVAVAAERAVMRVSDAGESSVVARSSEPWSPSGGMVDRNGDLWLLEYDTADTVRARHIDSRQLNPDQFFMGSSPRR